MDVSALQAVKRVGTVEYIEVRPGLNLTMYVAIPVPLISTYVLQVLEKYLAFIPPDSIKGYQKSNGQYGPLAQRVLTKEMNLLKNMPEDFEYYDLDLSSTENGSVGDFAFHFRGKPLTNGDLLLETNRISLEFPHDYHKQVEFNPFVQDILNTVECDSAWCGLAFNHAKIFEKTARKKILAMANRFHGIDVDYSNVQNQMKGRSPSVNWFTFINHAIASDLGGPDKIRKELQSGVEVFDLQYGLLVKAGSMPPVGDMNRGAEDTLLLRSIARVLKPKRFTITGFGTPDFDAMAWVERFDHDE